MATNFPTSLDSLTNPQGTDSVLAVPHAAQHANANDAIEALEAKVGANNSAVTTSLDYRVRTLESASVDTEAIQDIVGGMVSSNTETDITVEYNDTTGKLNFAAGANLVTTTSLTNTLTHPTTGYVPIGDLAQSDGVATLGPDGFVPASQLNLDEKIQDVAALMFTSATHSNITVAYDDNTGRLALTGIPLTQEQVQDFIAPLFAHAFHTNVTATYDDTNNRVILEGSGGGGSGTGGSLTNSWFLGA
jgi:carbon monoxide dehydrogenase subunit G